LWNRRANDVSPNRVIIVTIKNSSGVIVISIGNLFFLDRAVKTNKKGFIILWATICHVGAYLCIPLIGYYGLNYSSASLLQRKATRAQSLLVRNALE
jgi:hypothetical protein